MKFLQRFIACCALAAGVGGLSAALAADAPEALDKALKQDAVCTRCHDESETKPILSIYQTRHGVKADERTPTCQSCHGESKNHLGGNVEGKGRPKPDIIFGAKHTTAGYAPTEPLAQAEACLTCHKSGARSHWSGSEHQSRDVVCSNCHKVHVAKDPVMSKATQPEVCFACHKEQRAQTHRISTHPLAAGKMACTDCHNPHGSTGPKLLVKNNVNETCYTCHAEKRGPFLWEHGPVIDDCTNCHTPHGSTNPTLLKARVPFLCQECHSGDHGSTVNSGGYVVGGNVVTVNGTQLVGAQSPRSQLNARACLNCHVLVHGSNHPAGAKFQR
jgi:DmsE family decaheme c-type cytochrome